MLGLVIPQQPLPPVYTPPGDFPVPLYCPVIVDMTSPSPVPGPLPNSLPSASLRPALFPYFVCQGLCFTTETQAEVSARPHHSLPSQFATRLLQTGLARHSGRERQAWSMRGGVSLGPFDPSEWVDQSSGARAQFLVTRRTWCLEFVKPCPWDCFLCKFSRQQRTNCILFIGAMCVTLVIPKMYEKCMDCCQDDLYYLNGYYPWRPGSNRP